VGSLGARREGKEGGGRSGEERGAGAPFYRVGGGAGRRRRWWWWPRGAITPTILALHEGTIDEGEGKRHGWRPLHGGEGVDGEAAGRGGTPALGR
jgi:hypothetical protein